MVHPVDLPSGRDPSLIFQSSVGKPNTEWIDYDGSPPSSQSASSAIKALLEIRGQPLPPTTAGEHNEKIPFQIWQGKPSKKAATANSEYCVYFYASATK